VATHVFEYLGFKVDLQIAGKVAIQHGRLLEVSFKNGQQLTLRLDQGVSYWRAVSSRQGGYDSVRFDFGLSPQEQSKQIAEMEVQVEGAIHPTEIFVKVR
jgi:hypothetical protein